MVPMALLLNPFDTNTQYGSGENGLSVRQIPPPAAAAQRRQLEFEVQVGVVASAVIRPDMWYCAPLKLRMPGCVACVGPIRLHAKGWLVLLAFPVPSLFSPYV